MGDSELKYWTEYGNAFFVAFHEKSPELILGIVGLRLSTENGVLKITVSFFKNVLFSKINLEKSCEIVPTLCSSGVSRKGHRIRFDYRRHDSKIVTGIFFDSFSFLVVEYSRNQLPVEKIILDTSVPGSMRIYEKFRFFHEKNILMENWSYLLTATKPLHGIEHRQYSLFLRKSQLRRD